MPPLLTFDARRKIRSAWEWLRVFQLPNKLALLCAMLAAVFAVIAGALPAVAHGIHDHATAVLGVSTVGGATAADSGNEARDHRLKMQVATVEPDVTDNGAGEARGGACCCGSVACHAGVTLAMPLVAPPLQLGARVEPPLSSSRQQTVPMGLDRPPRDPASA